MLKSLDLPVVLLALPALLAPLGACTEPGEPLATSGSSPLSAQLVAETVQAFVAAHPRFGPVLEIQAMPDWAQGPRRRVATEAGRYIFYLEGSEVYAVYTFREAGGRIWLTGPRYRRTEPVSRRER